MVVGRLPKVYGAQNLPLGHAAPQTRHAGFRHHIIVASSRAKIFSRRPGRVTQIHRPIAARESRLPVTTANHPPRAPADEHESLKPVHEPPH